MEHHLYVFIFSTSFKILEHYLDQCKPMYEGGHSSLLSDSDEAWWMRLSPLKTVLDLVNWISGLWSMLIDKVLLFSRNWSNLRNGNMYNLTLRTMQYGHFHVTEFSIDPNLYTCSKKNQDTLATSTSHVISSVYYSTYHFSFGILNVFWKVLYFIAQKAGTEQTLKFLKKVSFDFLFYIKVVLMNLNPSYVIHLIPVVKLWKIQEQNNCFKHHVNYKHLQ